MKLKDNFVLQNIAENCIVVPVNSQASTFHSIFSLNEPVALLLRSMQNQQDHSLTKEEMISILTDQYLVDPETAATDLDVLIQDLVEMGLIEA